jgi:hypothetical protein
MRQSAARAWMPRNSRSAVSRSRRREVRPTREGYEVRSRRRGACARRVQASRVLRRSGLGGRS